MKKKLDIKRLILLNLPYVFAFYFVNKLVTVFRLAPGSDMLGKLTGGFANFGSAFSNPLPSFNPIDLLVGVAAGALLKLAVYIKGKNRKKFRQGEEYGSARWVTATLSLAATFVISTLTATTISLTLGM